MKMNALGWISFVLVVIGGLNWGLVGVLNLNLVQALFGTGLAASVVYDLVGLGAIGMIIGAFMMKDK